MAELTYRGPGFFEREIDISGRISPPVGVPAAIAATAERGPAFVPVVVGSFADFETRFGTFKIKKQRARIGRNPKDGSRIEIPAKNTIQWKMSKQLFKLLNNESNNNK